MTLGFRQYYLLNYSVTRKTLIPKYNKFDLKIKYYMPLT